MLSDQGAELTALIRDLLSFPLQLGLSGQLHRLYETKVPF